MAKRRQRKSGVTRFGNAASPHGAMYYVQGTRTADRVKLWASVLVDAVRAQGHRASFKLQLAARRRARVKLAELDAEIRARGVPDSMRRLLEAPTKRDKERVAKSLVLTAADFEALVYNCQALDLKHRTKAIELMPDHLEPTVEEYDAFRDRSTPDWHAHPPARKFFKKITRGMSERRCVVVHQFSAKNGEWHCFYFSHRDIFPDRRDASNHWTHGTHVHYLSHDWPEWTRESVWSALEERNASVSGLHVRFKDEREADEGEEEGAFTRYEHGSDPR